MNISGVKLGSIFEECQARVRVDHVLYKPEEIIGQNKVTCASTEHMNKARRIVVTAGQHSAQSTEHEKQ